MLLMLTGIAVIALTALVFVSLLPRGGKPYRLADTEYEPYVGVAFASAVALGVTMTTSGAIYFFGQ